MSGSFEKSVKSATKLKLAPPKAKWVERILSATRSGDAGVAEVFRVLQFRLRDSTWTIAFKALIVVHLMIREGAPDATLRYLSNSPRKQLAVNNYTDVQTQGRNIRYYSAYLVERAKAYGKTQHDFVHGEEGHLKKLTVDKGLLRETEVVQDQIHALLRCDLFSDEPENEITLTAFRLLTMDLLALFQVMNEGAINVLEHYFEMSKPDAERALAIYKTFAKQTDQVVKYLSVARQYEHSTRLEIPKIKHAPTSLSASLEEYLHDRDFDTNRRQYIAEKEAKRTGKALPPRATVATASTSKAPAATTSAFPDVRPTQAAKPPGPAPDLIDFFESIEQNQQQMATFPQQQQQQPQQMQQPFASQFTSYQPQQQTGFANGFQNNFQPPQQQTPSTNPFGQYQSPQIQTQPTGAGFGGYGPQPEQNFVGQTFQQQPTSPTSFTGQFGQPQQYAHQQQQPMQSQATAQASNPFRQSTMPSPMGSMQDNFTGHSAGNPFARSQNSGSPFNSQPPPIPTANPNFTPQTHGASASQLMPQRTGTNPFAANPAPAQSASGNQNFVMSQATGSTNPFRQSAFVNQQTGQGWQSNQGTMGGLESVPTIPVFPRLGQNQQQPAQQQNPW